MWLYDPMLSLSHSLGFDYCNHRAKLMPSFKKWDKMEKYLHIHGITLPVLGLIGRYVAFTCCVVFYGCCLNPTLKQTEMGLFCFLMVLFTALTYVVVPEQLKFHNVVKLLPGCDDDKSA